jgi:glutamine amidotransferase
MITIVNYGIGNIKAFANVFTRLNIPYNVASNKNDLKHATKILFPGVGSFDNAITLLNHSGMRDTLENLVMNNNIPILGVCVGMQMFASNSEEGKIDGLGWIDATVNKIPNQNGLITPHMGWNNIIDNCSNILLDGITNESYFYFLHSYYFNCFDDSCITVNSNYGIEFSSIVIKNNIYGVQFHPEKSHNAGMNLLNNFSKI